MRTGVQFTGTVRANKKHRWFTYGWPQQWNVIWTVIPTSPRSGAPQIEWEIEVERSNNNRITYWLTIKNLTPQDVNIEGRYAILN